MIVKGNIYGIEQDGTIIITAKINPDDLDRLAKWKVKECRVEPVDGRKLSEQQRKTTYMFIKAIADHIGESAGAAKNALKMDFANSLLETLESRMFSLSDAPMSLVAQFENYLVNFIVENNVPTNFRLYEFVSDMNGYVFMCMVNRKCAVCGRKADLHHCNGSTVGMGRDRAEISHLGAEALPLCREHHTEIHTIGQKDFYSRYHFDGGVKVDETIAKIYRLKI